MLKGKLGEVRRQEERDQTFCGSLQDIAEVTAIVIEFIQAV